MDAPYQRLADRLRQRIVSGAWPVGTQVPSLRELRAQYKLGRGVVELAVAELRREGLIEGKRGARPTVARQAPPARRILNPREDWPYGIGDKPAEGTRLATQDLADRMQVPLRTRLLWTRYECIDPDGWPAMLLTAFRRGRTAHEVRDTAVLLCLDEFTVREAALVGLAAGTAALRMQRTRYAPSGIPVETADLVLRADRWRIAM